MLFWLLLLPPLLAALIAFVVRPYRPWVGRAGVILALVALSAAAQLAGQVIAGGPAPAWGAHLGPVDLREFLRADSLSALLLLCVTAVAVLALWLGPGVRGEAGEYAPHTLRRFHIFFNLFVAAMLLAVSANNVGIMWIAVEATTIFSAFIIPLKLSKASVEASWKYILLGSVGVALAFAGTVLIYFGYATLAADTAQALNWPELLAIAPRLHPEAVQLGFVFLLIGYGTKAGLAPMHTWLPDAHSEAPASLSATMSGVLLAVALYAIMRWKVVVDAALGGRTTDTLLLILGLLSLVIAAFSMVVSRNYKRLLAYSSIEHTGLMAIGLALGPLGAFAALLHLVNHTVAKSMLFLLSGRVHHRYHSAEIKDVTGLLKAMPVTGGLFAAGMLAIMGLPPFGLFMSEFTLLRAGFGAGQPWLMALALALLAVAFIAFLRHLNGMLYGAPPAAVAVGEADAWDLAPLAVSVAALVILGLTLPGPLAALLTGAARILAGS
ncbi:MAG: Proton antipo protein [Chloroflexota bacterium]|nr:Proton antipo protein [Chloroflexota bacterium]